MFTRENSQKNNTKASSRKFIANISETADGFFEVEFISSTGTRKYLLFGGLNAARRFAENYVNTGQTAIYLETHTGTGSPQETSNDKKAA